MAFLSRLFRHSQDGDWSGKHANTTSKQANKAAVSVHASSINVYNTSAAMPPVSSGADTEDENEGRICAPIPMPIMSSGNSSMRRRRTAIDICPAAVQRFANKVAILESSHLRASLGGGGGVTYAELEALYADMQLIHRGRASMVYRAREIHTGRRVVIKAYHAAQMTSHQHSSLDRHIRAFKGAMGLSGPHGSVVALERVLENAEGTFLVMQACNGGTLIEAAANAGGKLPERQVAIKVAVPLLTALAELHSNGIVHRDIKPEHLMIHNGDLKLGDFGSAACTTAAAARMATISFSGCNEPASRLLVNQQQSQQQFQQQDGPVWREQQHHEQQAQDQSLFHQVLPGQPTAFMSHYGTNAPAGKLNSQPASSSAASVTAAACRQHSSAGGGVADSMNFRTGSIEYMAPEMLDKPTAAEVFHLIISKGIDNDELQSYDAKVDIWSLGVVLYEALTGVQPFLADTAAEMAAVIARKLNVVPKDGQKSLQAPTSCSQQQHSQSFTGRQAVDTGSLPAFIQQLPVSAQGQLFVGACLNLDSAKRPNAMQLLQHPWIAEMQANAAVAAAAKRRSFSSCSQSGVTMPPGAPLAAVAHALAAAKPTPCSTHALQSMSQQMLPQPSPAADVAAPGRLAVSRGDSASPELPRDQHLAVLAGPSEARAGALGSLVDDVDSFAGAALVRAQTSANLEVGVQRVLRTSTQRLLTQSRLPHVHAP